MESVKRMEAVAGRTEAQLELAPAASATADTPREPSAT